MLFKGSKDDLAKKKTPGKAATSGNILERLKKGQTRIKEKQ